MSLKRKRNSVVPFYNHVKLGVALNITGDGLKNLITETSEEFHNALFENISISSRCTSCNTANLLDCPTVSICKRPCNIHNIPDRKPRLCRQNVCNVLRDRIRDNHRYYRANVYEPSWRYTDSTLWSTDTFEIIKCFLPFNGYDDAKSVGDLDFQGIVSVIINNKYFQKQLSEDVSKPDNVFSKALEILSFYNGSSGLSVSDTELDAFLEILMQLLSDSKYLKDDAGARKALSSLQQNFAFNSDETFATMNYRNIEEQVTCPICLDRFRTPKQLPCQHTYCLPCLTQLNNTRSGVIRCPECNANHRIPAAGVAGFPPAIAIQRLLEAMPLPNEPHSSFSRVADIRQDRRVVLAPTNYSPYRQHENMHMRNIIEDMELYLALERSRQQRRNNSDIEQFNRNVFQRGRTNIREVLSGILHRHECCLIFTVTIYYMLTICRLVAGAVKVESDCPLERKVAVYLFVKSLFAIWFWSVLILWLCQCRLARALDNPFVEVYLVLETLFSLVWFFFGSVWLMGNFNEMKSSCPYYIEDWNQHFINLAMFLAVVDYIFLVAFLFYSGYIICET